MHLANVNVSILQNMDLPEGAGELMTDTKRILRKVMDDITQLSRSLHSDRITQIGVFAAIKHELTLFAQKKLFEVIISDPYSANGTEFPPETQLLVFRMFQEICNNIIKHAKAQTVSLSIQEKENGIELQVSDDGIGFTLDSPAGKAHNGVGMRSLKSRAVLFKGRIHINSILNKGTIISIFIPAPVS
jgi:signal transduction histidine kinase